MKRILTLLLLAGAVGCNRQTAESDLARIQAADFAFVDVHVVHPSENRVDPHRIIVVDAGKIAAVLPASKIDSVAADKVVDLGGRYVIPGLWDAHTHLGSDADDLVDRVFPSLVSSGVTHVRDMGSTLASMQMFKRIAASGESPVPSIIAAGPLLDGQELSWYGDLQLVLETPDDVNQALPELVEAGVDFFKAYSNLDAEVYSRLLDEAKRLGVAVDGHVPAKVGLAAVARGHQRTIEHLDSFALQSCSADGADWFKKSLAARFERGPAAYAEVMAGFWESIDWDRCGKALRELGERGAAWTPTLIMEAFAPDRVTADALRYASTGGVDWCNQQLAGVAETPEDLRDRSIAGLRDAFGRIEAAGIKVLAGTDFPNNCSIPGISVAHELELLVDAGLSPANALESATGTPAAVFGLAKLGHIAQGYTADFLVLNGNPLESIAAVAEPNGVFTASVWHDEEALSAMRERVMNRAAELPK